eukprot:gnl/Chilomastix_caulleri/372.p1 GENE.gnl/Chilomastix_caulleri/372~~gnl/Chilomastix_caulleri/372.p1  ORF type:complete len:315 (+),score=90.20 gnl/Chilomastix_caulleri/372:631-1575(+)
MAPATGDLLPSVAGDSKPVVVEIPATEEVGLVFIAMRSYVISLVKEGVTHNYALLLTEYSEGDGSQQGFIEVKLLNTATKETVPFGANETTIKIDVPITPRSGVDDINKFVSCVVAANSHAGVVAVKSVDEKTITVYSVTPGSTSIVRKLGTLQPGEHGDKFGNAMTVSNIEESGEWSRFIMMADTVKVGRETPGVYIVVASIFSYNSRVDDWTIIQESFTSSSNELLPPGGIQYSDPTYARMANTSGEMTVIANGFAEGTDKNKPKRVRYWQNIHLSIHHHQSTHQLPTHWQSHLVSVSQLSSLHWQLVSVSG